VGGEGKCRGGGWGGGGGRVGKGMERGGGGAGGGGERGGGVGGAKWDTVLGVNTGTTKHTAGNDWPELQPLGIQAVKRGERDETLGQATLAPPAGRGKKRSLKTGKGQTVL